MQQKRHQLEKILTQHAPLMIAYSGGVDSAYLVAVAHQVLGDQVTAVIADSPSLPRAALADAIALAKKIGIALRVVKTKEMDNPDYAENPPNRCYFCKAELFSTMSRLAETGDFAALAYGENADDAHMERPGQQAATEFAVLAPLREAGLTKLEIRSLSHDLGLPTADLPAQPCLSSRIPHGTTVTTEALQMVEDAEAIVRSLGFVVFRVRHVVGSNATSPSLRANVQIGSGELSRLTPALQAALETGVKAVGYHSVTIDPNGYQSPL